MKTSNFSDCSGNESIKNFLDLIRVHFNSLCRHNVSQENNKITHKGAFLEINIETHPAKELTDFIKMLKTIFCFVVDLRYRLSK